MKVDANGKRLLLSPRRRITMAWKMVRNGTKWDVVDDKGKVVDTYNTSGAAQTKINQLNDAPSPTKQTGKSWK